MKQIMLWISAGIVLLIGGWSVSAFAVGLKVGCVDIQKAVNECIAGKVAKKAIIKEVEEFQRIYAQKQKELQTLKESLDNQSPLFNPEARATKGKEFQSKLREFQRWIEDKQNEINQEKQETERNISIDLLKVIRKIGEEEGYLFILRKNENTVLFGSKSIDLTDRVIKVYNLQKKQEVKDY